VAAQVRLARADEFDLVHRITQSAFSEYRGALPVESGALAETVADVEAAMREGGAVVANVDNEPVGTARYVRQGDELYVGRVAVLPGHRRRGVASAMMRFLEQLAPSLGCKAVRIGVRESLPSNIALYQSLGYEVVSVDQHPRGPDRSVSMRKTAVD
jgi:ribosomal protein S18 acetylase RimI-like enzyme